MRSRPLIDQYAIEALARGHEHSRFSCKVEALDDYLRRRASQDQRRNVASVFAAVELASGEVHGYSTLSMAGVLLDLLPPALMRRLPGYPTVPAVRLRRLAVHESAQGRGLGTHLLMDAMARSLRSEVAWAAFLVEATDESAREFYVRLGFRSLSDDPNHLYMMRKTIEPLFASPSAGG